MKISVIVPYKNEEPFIGRTLDSMVKQRGHFQFIFVNDGSEDKSEEIVKRYDDERIIMANNKHKAGVSGARNTGIELADGDYVTFVDADDEMADGAWKSYIKAIRGDRKTSILQLNHLRFYDSIGKSRIKYDNPEGYYTTERPPEAWVVVWNKLYKKDLIKKVRFKEGLNFGEDELFNLECFSIENRIYHIPEVAVVKHFDNQNSLSKMRKEPDLLAFVKAMQDKLKKEQNIGIRMFICGRLSYHWKSPAFLRIFDKSKEQ